ncbi:GntR family transcriptional regulator (plasmid) [Paraburkholderia sp. PGU19]|uniref:GntR family transcriptional regulator n=1 Tax=Paraburkholderia sp. PGU19 TaxID=2735434 RepID=UPI0015DBF52B|nr:GntR family transcriptional regulator [Paraburkholderia sp. PGU19]BCG03202.1 GntR family transcriptional regulator [Paraburkholderia sp. PGU19]
MTTVRTSVKSAPAQSVAEADQSVTDRILTTIRDDIIEGKLLPGTALVENELTQLHDVSRNTLREALRLLCREGLAVHYRHRGVIVRTLTRHDVRDIYRVRRTLELQALVREEPIEEADLALMREAIRCAQEALEREDWRAVGTYSLLFHRHIVRLLHSALFDAFFTTILAQLRLVFGAAPDEKRFQTPWVAKDQRIFALIERGHLDKAQAALADYLTESEHAMLDYL